jgi:chromosome partitioning protein
VYAPHDLEHDPVTQVNHLQYEIQMKSLSIMSYKGGVGKTSMATSLAQALAIAGKRVLLLDNDSQHNASLTFGITRTTNTLTDLYRASLGEATAAFNRCVTETPVRGLHVIPSSSALCNADIRDAWHLHKVFNYIRLDRRYDYIIFDNAPGIDTLQESSLRAADMVLVPTELSFFALSGLQQLQKALQQRFDRHGIDCIVANGFKKSSRHTTFFAHLRDTFRERVAATAIPFDMSIEAAVIEQKSLFLYRTNAPAAQSYLKLVEEIFDLDHDILFTQIVKRREQRMGTHRQNASACAKEFSQRHFGAPEQQMELPLTIGAGYQP